MPWGLLNISDLALNQVAATILVGARGGPERSLDVTSAGARGQTAWNGAFGAQEKPLAPCAVPWGVPNITDLALNQVAATFLAGAWGGPERSLDVTSAGARGQAA